MKVMCAKRGFHSNKFFFPFWQQLFQEDEVGWGGPACKAPGFRSGGLKQQAQKLVFILHRTTRSVFDHALLGFPRQLGTNPALPS